MKSPGLSERAKCLRRLSRPWAMADGVLIGGLSVADLVYSSGDACQEQDPRHWIEDGSRNRHRQMFGHWNRNMVL
jgi:hypothetical protein